METYLNTLHNDWHDCDYKIYIVCLLKRYMRAPYSMYVSTIIWYTWSMTMIHYDTKDAIKHDRKKLMQRRVPA